MSSEADRVADAALLKMPGHTTSDGLTAIFKPLIQNRTAATTPEDRARLLQQVRIALPQSCTLPTRVAGPSVITLVAQHVFCDGTSLRRTLSLLEAYGCILLKG